MKNKLLQELAEKQRALEKLQLVVIQECQETKPLIPSITTIQAYTISKTTQKQPPQK